MSALPLGGRATPIPEAIRIAMEHHQAGRLAEAEAIYLQVLQADPGNAQAWQLMGIIAHQAGKNELSLEWLDKALAIVPDHAEALSNRGLALHDLGRPAEAIESYRKALAIRPGFAEALHNLGNTLLQLGRYEEALASYDGAVQIAPVYADALCNRGNVLQKLKRYSEALASYERSIAANPMHAYAHWNYGLCCLVTGDFARGWQEIEWRWENHEFAKFKRPFTQPLWQGGESLGGKTILLHAEQGLGDTLQFCRYAPMVAARGATVLLEVQGALKPLLEGLEGVSRLFAQGEELPAFDYHCPLLSLPRAFGTRVDSIPAAIPYVRADEALVQAWQARLGPRRGARIGIAWSATTATDYGIARSLALSRFVQLIPDGAQCVSLQKDLTQEERAIIEARPDIEHFGTGFADTAALVALVDIVVSVDTSIGHLTGAMGKPVWIVMPYVGDWRWMVDREDSPWYPSARIFRQPAPGDWASVLDRVKSELESLPL